MRIVPDSTISLYANVDIGDGEQIAFSSRTTQGQYFQSKLVQTVSNCTMNKKTGRLKINLPGSVVAQCNYLSFVNPSYDNKVYYAHITDYFYENNELTEIDYVIDRWQTWMFDVNFESMYIDREHLSKADYQTSLTNPYDPSIIEFRTTEDLPVGPDTEKPYYDFGIGNTHDGMYCAQTLAAALNVENRNGTLVIFSDIGLENMDSVQGGLSRPLAEVLKALRDYDEQIHLYPTSFYKLSHATHDYLATQYPTLIPANTPGDWGNDRWTGSAWSSTSLGTLKPADSNISVPCSYIYFDGTDIDTGLSADTYTKGLVSKLLNWFTERGVLDNLIGIYTIPTGMILFSGTLASVTPSSIHLTHHTAKDLQVENKKLCLYPYAYLRAISPNNDVCELRYESFKDVQDGGNDCNLALCLDITEKPALIAAPESYKASNAAPFNPVSNMNVREGLIFGQFPCMPYSIDAWKMQLATLSNNLIANNTVDYSYELQQKQLDLNRQYVGVASDVLNAVVSGVQKNYAGMISSAVNATLNATQAQLTAKKNQNEFAQSQEAYEMKKGTKDNAVYNNFKWTRPAYCANEYHQINGDGILNTNINSFSDILYQKVVMNPAIVQKYDEYFKCFGFSSGRFGVPRVLQFVKGASQDADLPHWTTIDNKECTYIKTSDAKITGAMLPVISSIKSMLDGGIRMLNGDSLLGP